MQSTFADDRKMMDQGYKGILNLVDYATRRSFPYALRKTGDAREAGRKFVEMIKQVRTEFYGDADSDEWTVPEMTVVIDGGTGVHSDFKMTDLSDLPARSEILVVVVGS
eukprot:COSAG05_NODE_686_length_7932_cov_3.338823_3_plen_109_part_00